MRSSAETVKSKSYFETGCVDGPQSMRSNDAVVVQLDRHEARKVDPRVSSKISAEMVQFLFVLLDAGVIFSACLIACPTISMPFVLASAAGTALFVLGKALMSGYSRTSLA